MNNSNVPLNPENLLNLEMAIHRTVNDINKLKDQIKEQKDMYDSTIENDAAYATQAKKEEEVKKITIGLKQQLLKSPAVQDTSEKLKELKDDMKGLQTGLSELLKRYQTVSGLNQITRDDGEIFEIVSTMKLIKKKA